MGDREELAALRRMAELEARARPPQAPVDPTEGMGGMQKFLAGVGSGMTDLAYGAGQRLGLVDQKTIDEKKALDAPLTNTGAGVTGSIVGKTAATLPTMFIPGANTIAGAGAIGGVLGALEPTATGESVGKNVALGAGGGALGQMAGQAIGRVLRPVQTKLSPAENQLVRSAQARGIPLDAADLTQSRPLKTMRDVMGQMPLTADRQAAIQASKQAAFNKAVGSTFGAPEEALTHDVLQGARNRIGQEFTDLSARNQLNPNAGLIQELERIRQQAGRDMTPDVAGVVNNKIDDILARFKGGTPEQIIQSKVLSESGNPFTKVVPATPASPMPGTAYRALDSELGRITRTSSNGDIRNAVGGVRSALRNAMDASISDADKAAWQQARKQYANLMTVAPLAARSETGDVSGRALLAKALQGSKSSAFSGGGELGELGRIGKAFVAEQTPNSGTPQRLFFQRLLENPLSAAWSYGVGGVSLPAQKLMNSAAGQHYLANGALPITSEQRMLANALMRGGAAAALPGYLE